MTLPILQIAPRTTYGGGGPQNAPLGRAVIGGLIFATGATLFFVPTVFMILRRGKKSQISKTFPELVSGPQMQG
jgi:uncharacterized membrane protein YedE/YeeE